VTRRIETSLLVVEGFTDDGFEYRAGDRAPLAFASIRRLALAKPEMFIVEHVAEPLDVAWLRAIDEGHEAAYQQAKKEQEAGKERAERALRDELKAQEERRDDPKLSRRFEKQERDGEERREAVRENRKRQQLERQAALSTAAVFIPERQGVRRPLRQRTARSRR
jgi:hypothetical protein